MSPSSADARRAAVLGSPIGHSLSPTLHRAAYEVLGLGWRYDAFDVDESHLRGFLDEVRADPAWVGLSLTMPLKEQALSLADTASEVARATQAANTLIVGDGRLHADNTDPTGITWALARAGIADLHGHQPVVMGAGATARSAIAAVASLGATDAIVSARRPEAITELAVVAADLGVNVSAASLRDGSQLLTAGLVISTLPAGVMDQFSDAVPELPGVLFDVIYAPWPTSLAQSWVARGGAVVGGLEMLVGQAGRQVELMTGRSAPLAEMLAAGLAAQQRVAP
ncbi:MAG: shikimate dehydrogenase [Actinobacteria bacterium]|nr:shikimate dehydrogenase [Actinomycetota bacterium]